jgi:hypothetical protein
VELAQQPVVTEALSEPLAWAANLGIAESSLLETIIEEIGLHL